MDEQRELTLAQKMMGVNFNPNGDPTVAALKQSYADTLTLVLALRDASSDSEQKRLLSIAITDLQGSQMWAVKGATWGMPK